MTNHEKRELILTSLDENSKWFEVDEIISLLVNNDVKRRLFRNKIDLIKEALPNLNDRIEGLDHRARILMSPLFRAVLFDLVEADII